jgi:hypothetical protein
LAATGIQIIPNTAIPSPSINNLVIDKNNFSTLLYGIAFSTDVSINKLEIVRNTLDFITGAAMKGEGFTRNLTFHENYLERCGGDAVPVEISTGVFEDRYGAIILSKKFNLAEGFKGLSIKYNNFGTVNQDAPVGERHIISIENVDDGVISDNSVLSGDTYDSFVSLDGVGITAASFNVQIIHSDNSSSFPILVRKNTNTDSGYANFSALHRHAGSREQKLLPPIFEDMNTWTSGAATIVHSISTGIPAINYISTGQNKQLEITDETKLDLFRGKYCRVIGSVLPDSPSTNGLTVTYSVDVGSGFVEQFSSGQSGTENVRITNGEIVYIPLDAVGIRINTDVVSDGTIDIFNLQLVDTAFR